MVSTSLPGDRKFQRRLPGWMVGQAGNTGPLQGRTSGSDAPADAAIVIHGKSPGESSQRKSFPLEDGVLLSQLAVKRGIFDLVVNRWPFPSRKSQTCGDGDLACSPHGHRCQLRGQAGTSGCCRISAESIPCDRNNAVSSTPQEDVESKIAVSGITTSISSKSPAAACSSTSWQDLPRGKFPASQLDGKTGAGHAAPRRFRASLACH